MCLECHYPGVDIFCLLMLNVGMVLNFDEVYFIDKMSGKYIKSRWAPFICQ
jgi:hypothetical protein